MDLCLDTTPTTVALNTTEHSQQLISATSLKYSNVPYYQIAYYLSEQYTTKQTRTVYGLENEDIKDSELVLNARSCLERGKMDLCPTGVGGTYFVRDESDNAVAIFKPTDEEPGAFNNPKRIIDSPILPAGGGAKREVAAFLLGHMLANVPETRFLETIITVNKGSKTKSGSIQKFVENDGDATTFGSSRFCTQDVHNIGILDLRLLNKDRNGENVLVQKKDDQYHLVPIDHAYVLPDVADGIWFEWMTWKQAKLPFSKESRNYLKHINMENDVLILRSLSIEEDCINLMKLSTLLLQTGADASLTLFDIASMVCRRKPTEKSDFENIVELAKGKTEEQVKRIVFDLVQDKCRVKK